MAARGGEREHVLRDDFSFAARRPPGEQRWFDDE
jgi:hypothetical protein